MDKMLSKSSRESMLLTYVKSIFKALIIAVLAFVLISAMMTFTSMPQKTLFIIAYIVLFLDLVFCGMQSAYKMKKNGFFNGLLCGALYVAFLVIMSMALVKGFKFDGRLLMKAVTGIIASGIGGMFGVNLK